MFKKFQLKNGLQVLMIESHKSPVVSIQMWVRTGSADEPKKQEGISHFIEHLLFKGTEKFKVGEIASKIEGSGGELNAYTSFDQTVFYVTISKHFDEMGLEAISQMMGFPLFDKQEIDNEREVVIEEIKRGNDSPHRQASRQLFETVYKKHPYSIPVIGFEDNIRKITREQIVDYYQSRYVPENMTLILVGDFEPQDMKKKVSQYFGAFQVHKLKRVARPKEQKQNQTRISVKQAPFEESLLYLSWSAPRADHQDVPALDVLGLILGQGESSRLNKRMRIEEPIVNYVGASTFTPQDPGFVAVSMSLNNKNLKSALDLLGSELGNFLETGPTSEELEKALLNINSEEFYALETVDGMARKFGTYEHLFRDYKYFKQFLKQINGLSTTDILKAARKYLKPETLSVSYMTPGDKVSAQKIIRAWTKSYKSIYTESRKSRGSENQKTRLKKLTWFPRGESYSAARDRVTVKTLKSGAKLILRPSFDTPMLSLRCAYLGGVRVEPQQRLGVTELLSRVWVSGTKEMSETELHLKIEKLASSLSAFGGRNTVGLTMTTLTPFQEEMFPLFEHTFLHPRLPEEAIEREKLSMLEVLKTRKDSPAQIAILNFTKELFKGHPYSRDPQGSEESIPTLERGDLVDHLGQMSMAKNLTFALSGYFDSTEWVERIENMTQRLPKGHAIKNHFSSSVTDQNRKVYEFSDKEQSHIVIGYPGLTFTDPDRHALQVLQSILAGQGGRLFLELRDKASLAYTVAPLRMEGIDTGYFGAYIGCSPEKGAKAIAMLREEFSRLMETLVPQEELMRAKKYLVGRHDIDLQKNSAVSAAMLFDEIYGLSATETFQFAEKILRVSSQDVQRVARRIFSQPELLSVVGRVDSSI